MWDEESWPCSEGFEPSLDDGQEVSEGLTEFYFCANFIPAGDLATLREIDFECYQDRIQEGSANLIALPSEPGEDSLGHLDSTNISFY